MESTDRKVSAKSVIALPGHHRPLRIAVHEGREVISTFLRLYRVWQRPLTVFIGRTLKPGEVFIDVGANIGYFTIIAAAAVGPSGRVHAFEPDPVNYALLRSNCALNDLGNVTRHKAAVGASDGTGSLHRAATNRGAHSLVHTTGDLLQVPIVTLDRALAAEPGPVQLIKIDVQGFDLPVLWGMESLILGQDVPPRIILEFSPTDVLRDDPDLQRFRAFVERHGYNMHHFIPNERKSVWPPRIGLETLKSLADDYIRFGENAEFDILLSPSQS